MRILVTGSAGYVGNVLLNKLVYRDYEVNGIDLYPEWSSFRQENNPIKPLKETKGDIRDIRIIKKLIANCDAVIHLACISNDPSFDLDPELGKSINYDAFRPLVRAAKDAGVKRFIYASSSSVYGVKSDMNVTEDLTLEPLTDYSKYKAMCEDVLLEERSPGFETVIVRPATICGYSPSMRFDLSVHILTKAAVKQGNITVFGGQQYRPHIHIDDMIDAYITLLEAPADKVDGQTFNVGYTNYTMAELAKMVKSVVGEHVEIETQPLNNDPRSYHISSEKIKAVLGWEAKRSIQSAIGEVRDSLTDGRVSNPNDDRYYTIRRIKQMGLAA